MPGAVEYRHLLEEPTISTGVSKMGVSVDSSLVGGNLEPMDPVGDAAKAMSMRNEALADWKSFCICAT